MQIGSNIKHCKRGILQLLAIGAIFTGLLSHSYAIEPIGDDSELFVTGTASVTENDNLFLNHTNQTRGTIFDVTPGLSYEFGKNNSLTKGQFAAYEDFQYTSETDKGHLNAQLANIVFNVRYDDDKNKMSAEANFHQADQAEVGIQNTGYLVHRNLFHVDANEEISLTDKSSLGGSLVFDDTDYKTAGFADWRYTEVPLNYYYKFEPKLDLSAGFRFRTNTVGPGGIDSNDYYYNVGARGEFTPRLSGQLDIGFNQAKFDGGHTQGGLGADSSFTYAYDDKTSLKFGFNDDYGYSATSAAYRNYGPYIGASTLLYERLTANAQVSYNKYDYITSSQRDDFYSVLVGVSYQLTLKVSVAANYSYSEDSSNFTADSFKDNMFSVSATAHF